MTRTFESSAAAIEAAAAFVAGGRYEDAMSAIHVGHMPRLKRLIVRRAGPGEFDDIYNAVLTDVWRGLPSFRSESSLDTWIYSIALNTVNRWSSRRGASEHLMTSLLTSLAQSASSGGETQLHQKREYEATVALCRKLFPEDLDVIQGVAEQRSWREIAERRRAQVAGIEDSLDSLAEALRNRWRRTIAPKLDDELERLLGTTWRSSRVHRRATR